MAMLPANGVQGLMTGILGSAAALAIAFPLALGGSVYDPAAATGAARTGLYATNGAGSESIAYVVGGQTGPIHLSNGSGVQTQLSGGTQTGASFPVLSLSQTWNNAATAFIAFFANITSTASATGSQLVNLQVGSVAQFTVSKAGDIGGGSLNVSRTITAGGAITLNQASGNAILTINAPTGSTPQVQFQINAVNKVNITAQSSASFQFNDNANTTTPISYTAGAIGAGFVTFANTLDASSSTVAGHVLSGGLAVAKSVQVGTSITTVNGNITLNNTSGAGTLTVNSTTNAGGLLLGSATGNTSFIAFDVNSVEQTRIAVNTTNLRVIDQINTTTPLTYTPGAIGAGFWTFANTTVSTSSATGAVVISGGLGVASAVNAGGVVITGTALQCSSARTSYTGSNHVDIYRSGGTITPNAGDMVFQSDIAGTNGFYWAAKAATANVMSLTGAGNLTVTGSVTVGSTTLLTSSVALTNNAGASAGTLTNAPSVGNPTKWIPINDNGTTRNIPAW